MPLSYFTHVVLKCPILACAVCGGEFQYGWTALMRAASGGCADCVRLLIDAGADKDAKSKVRETDSVLMDHTLCNVSFQHFILYVFRQSSVLKCSKCLVVSISLALSKWHMPCPSL